MRLRWLAALGIALGLTAAPSASLALTILTVSGGPGLKAQSQICASPGLCPGFPVFTLIGTAAASGFFDYNSGAGTADFTLTLTADGNFGGVSILTGSTFSATGVPVMQSNVSGGIQITQNGSATGSAAMNLPPGFSPVLQTPLVSSLTCTIGTGADQCGVQLGGTGLTFNQVGAGTYETFLTFDVNVVPEPASLTLVGAGIAALLLTRRRLHQG